MAVGQTHENAGRRRKMQHLCDGRRERERSVPHGARRGSHLAARPSNRRIQRHGRRHTRVAWHLAVAGRAAEGEGVARARAWRSGHWHRRLARPIRTAHKAHVTLVISRRARTRFVVALGLVELVAHEAVSLGLAAQIPLPASKHARSMRRRRVKALKVRLGALALGQARKVDKHTGVALVGRLGAAAAQKEDFEGRPIRHRREHDRLYSLRQRECGPCGAVVKRVLHGLDARRILGHDKQAALVRKHMLVRSARHHAPRKAGIRANERIALTVRTKSVAHRSDPHHNPGRGRGEYVPQITDRKDGMQV